MRLGSGFLVILVLAGPASASQPWEIWRDLRSLAVLDGSSQVLLRSTHCLSGCASDKHAPGDWRFLRMDGDEGVIFEESGPGAITRLWMTTGTTVSAPLPASVRIRFYFDGETTPRLNLPLPDLFSGSTAPFLAPLVADRLSSSGGFASYVPLPYERGCRVTLSGAEDLRLWFQFSHHRLPAGRAVSTFTGTEDLSPLTALLASAGQDPWPAGSSLPPVARSLTLQPQEVVTLASLDTAGVITELRLSLAPTSWEELRVTLVFDGETTVDLPASQLFASNPGDVLPTRSLWVGVDQRGELYSWFPLPFFQSARILLTHTGSTPLSVEGTVRLHQGAPLPGSGRFAALLTEADPLPIGADLSFLALDRPGRWVGLAGRFGAAGGIGRRYLEGDERVRVDGSRHPQLYGTGVEDFFGGGFYFDQGPFRRALYGMTGQGPNENGEDETSAYRLMLTDAVPFAASIRAGLEAGPTGEEPMRAQLVAWAYVGEGGPLEVADALMVGDASSRAAHAYTVTGPTQPTVFTGSFEGEPPLAAWVSGLVRDVGTSASFELDGRSCAGAPRLRRLVDVGAGGQAVAISLAGTTTGEGWLPENPARRLLESDLVWERAPAVFSFLVTGVAFPDGARSLVELSYQLLCPSRWRPLFADGFESGDTSAWSSVEPGAARSGAAAALGTPEKRAEDASDW